jgi:GntR family transcriptional regulator / MocR family aminotransferase
VCGRRISRRVAWQVDIGRVAAGSRVPSTRALARQLGLSHPTVALAFDALVADGYLGSRVGDGTYVLDCTHRARSALWERRRRWIRDPDGLLIWMVT